MFKKYLLFIVIEFVFVSIFVNAQDLPATFKEDYSHKLHDHDIGRPYDDETLKPSFFNDELESKRIPEPIGGYGTLHLIVKSVYARNHKVISQKANKCELWVGNELAYSLKAEDVKYDEDKKVRFFDFPHIRLKTGYYFLSVRMYSDGAIFDKPKFHEEIFQVGIHENKTTVIQKRIPFYHF